MSGIEPRERKYFILLLVLCIAMTGANLYVLRVNKALRDYVTSNARAVQEGTVVSTISGLGIDDNPVSVSTARNKATVVMVFSPTCPYCKKNWPAWASLIHQTTNPSINFVLVDITSTVTHQFLETKQIERTQVIRKLDPAQFVALNLNLTPQTIVIGSDSKVREVFTGAMTPEEITKLATLLT